MMTCMSVWSAAAADAAQHHLLTHLYSAAGASVVSVPPPHAGTDMPQHDWPPVGSRRRCIVV